MAYPTSEEKNSSASKAPVTRQGAANTKGTRKPSICLPQGRWLVAGGFVVLAMWWKCTIPRGIPGSGLGPPPREKLSRPTLDESIVRLKAVRADASAVQALPYLRAAYAILTTVDALPGLDIVRSDILGNCDKIWRHIKNEDATLQQMCDAEIEARQGDVKKAGHTDGTACNAMLWLQRALRLVNGIYKELVRDTKLPLAKCTYNAYGVPLKRHHNFVMKSIFGAAVNLGPSRENFFRMLAPKSTEAEALKMMAKVTPAFGKLLDAVEEYLVARKIESRG